MPRPLGLYLVETGTQNDRITAHFFALLGLPSAAAIAIADCISAWDGPSLVYSAQLELEGSALFLSYVHSHHFLRPSPYLRPLPEIQVEHFVCIVSTPLAFQLPTQSEREALEDNR